MRVNSIIKIELITAIAILFIKVLWVSESEDSVRMVV